MATPFVDMKDSDRDALLASNEKFWRVCPRGDWQISAARYAKVDPYLLVRAAVACVDRAYEEYRAVSTEFSAAREVVHLLINRNVMYWNVPPISALRIARSRLEGRPSEISIALYDAACAVEFFLIGEVPAKEDLRGAARHAALAMPLVVELEEAHDAMAGVVRSVIGWDVVEDARSYVPSPGT